MEAYIASLSMSMAQQSVQSSVSTGMLKKSMETAEQVSQQMIEAISDVPPAAGNVGTLLDVRA